MRTRNGLVLCVVLLLLAGIGVPAAASPDKSPAFEAVPFSDAFYLPNPCVDDGFEEWWHYEGTLYRRQSTTPSGNYHYLDWWRVAISTDSGFQMPERMNAGTYVEKVSDDTYVYTGTGSQMLTNEDGQKLRLHMSLHATVIDDDIKVEFFDLDVTCLGNK